MEFPAVLGVFLSKNAVRPGSGPILAILKAKLWPNLTDRFWPKMILAYFVSGFRPFLVHQLVLCVWFFWLTVISHFC